MGAGQRYFDCVTIGQSGTTRLMNVFLELHACVFWESLDCSYQLRDGVVEATEKFRERWQKRINYEAFLENVNDDSFKTLFRFGHNTNPSVPDSTIIRLTRDGRDIAIGIFEVLTRAFQGKARYSLEDLLATPMAGVSLFRLPVLEEWWLQELLYEYVLLTRSGIVLEFEKLVPEYANEIQALLAHINLPYGEDVVRDAVRRSLPHHFLNDCTGSPIPADTHKWKRGNYKAVEARFDFLGTVLKHPCRYGPLPTRSFPTPRWPQHILDTASQNWIVKKVKFLQENFPTTSFDGFVSILQDVRFLVDSCPALAIEFCRDLLKQPEFYAFAFETLRGFTNSPTLIVKTLSQLTLAEHTKQAEFLSSDVLRYIFDPVVGATVRHSLSVLQYPIRY